MTNHAPSDRSRNLRVVASNECQESRSYRGGRAHPDHWMVWLAVAGVVVCGSIALRLSDDRNNAPEPTPDEATDCVASDAEQTVVLPEGAGAGINNLVYEIEGSGESSDDPCFSESVSIVRSVVGSVSPRALEPYVIPVSIQPVES